MADEASVADEEVQILGESRERDSSLKKMCLDVLERTVAAMEEDLTRCENVAKAQMNALLNVHEDRKGLFRKYMHSMVTDAEREMSTTTNGIFKVGMHFIYIYIYMYAY